MIYICLWTLGYATHRTCGRMTSNNTCPSGGRGRHLNQLLLPSSSSRCATLFDINMGLDAPLSTPSGLFLPDNMHLSGPIEDGIGVGSLQLDDDLFPC